MIGNDIIDLSLSKKESQWERKGFLNKLFTKEEQRMIYSSLDPERMVWNLWSRKEAAYKIFNRQTLLKVFNPLQLNCYDEGNDNEFEYGRVKIFDFEFYTKTTITHFYIYTETVVKIDDFDKIIQISRPKNIQKNHGVPSYFDFDAQLIKPLSITHHGAYCRVISI